MDFPWHPERKASVHQLLSCSMVTLPELPKPAGLHFAWRRLHGCQPRCHEGQLLLYTPACGKRCRHTPKDSLVTLMIVCKHSVRTSYSSGRNPLQPISNKPVERARGLLSEILLSEIDAISWHHEMRKRRSSPSLLLDLQCLSCIQCHQNHYPLSALQNDVLNYIEMD